MTLETIEEKSANTTENGSVLLVANWDSNVGYAWWLMESFWVAISQHYAGKREAILAYPSISVIPQSITDADIQIEQCVFSWQNHPSSLREQLRFIKEHRCRILYLSDFPLYSFRYLAYRSAGIQKIIVHDHAPGQRSAATGLKRQLKKAIFAVKPLCADAVIATSEYVHQRHLQSSCVPAQNCYTAANGLPAQKAAIAPADLNELFGIAKGKTVMLTTGRANTYKGIDFAIECLAYLKQQDKAEELHYLFCGDGPDLENFKILAKELNVEDKITFAGRQDNIPSLLQSVDFAIHPSKGEVGYSLSILEYMQAGLPVIVPNNSSVCEATRDGTTGFIYQESSVQSCCEKIEILLQDNNQRVAMGRAAALAVIEQYSLDNTHNALTSAFKAIDPL